MVVQQTNSNNELMQSTLREYQLDGRDRDGRIKSAWAVDFGCASGITKSRISHLGARKLHMAVYICFVSAFEGNI